MGYRRVLDAMNLWGEAEEVLAAARQEAELHNNAELHFISVTSEISNK